MSLFSSDSDESDLEMLTLLSDWDSDTDYSVKTEKKQHSKRRKIKRVNYMQSLEDGDFTFRFRLPKSTVESLLIKVLPHVRVTSARNHGVPPLHQILLTLRFYALGAMLSTVADFVGVSKSTSCRIVNDISAAIVNLYDKYITMDQDHSGQFYQIAGFPRVLGAIDCTHVRVQSQISSELAEEFRNSRGHLSIKVQAICDANLKFINVDPSWPGSTSDAAVFNISNIKAKCEEGQFGDRVLLGDTAYPNGSCLVTPILEPLSESERVYNEAHIKTWKTIESTLYLWKQRFPVLVRPLRLSLPRVQAIIIATAILHNVCREENIAEVPSEIEQTEEEVIEVHNTEESDYSERTNIIHQYFIKKNV